MQTSPDFAGATVLQRTEYMGDGKKTITWDISRRIPSPATPMDDGSYDVMPLPELAELRQVMYMGDGAEPITEEYLKALTPLSHLHHGCEFGSWATSFTVDGLQGCHVQGRFDVAPEFVEEVVPSVDDTSSPHPVDAPVRP